MTMVRSGVEVKSSPEAEADTGLTNPDSEANQNDNLTMRRSGLSRSKLQIRR